MRAMLSPVPLPKVKYRRPKYVGVKAAQFSFARLKGTDPILGVEMASTGEVGCLGETMSEALLKAVLSVGFTIPSQGIFFSSRTIMDLADFLPSVQKLSALGYRLYAPPDVAAFYGQYHVDVTPLALSRDAENSVHGALRLRKVDLVISIPQNGERKENEDEFRIRRTAADFEIPLITNIQLAKAHVDALEEWAVRPLLPITSWAEYRY